MRKLAAKKQITNMQPYQNTAYKLQCCEYWIGMQPCLCIKLPWVLWKPTCIYLKWFYVIFISFLIEETVTNKNILSRNRRQKTEEEDQKNPPEPGIDPTTFGIRDSLFRWHSLVLMSSIKSLVHSRRFQFITHYNAQDCFGFFPYKMECSHFQFSLASSGWH